MHSPKGGKSPQGWSVGKVLGIRACPKGQIRCSLVRVLVLRRRNCQKMQLSSRKGVLLFERFLSSGGVTVCRAPSQGKLA
jgi:hypothetical protein